MPTPHFADQISVSEINAHHKFLKRLLFVGHTANVSGAPMVLLHLCRWLASNTEIVFDVWLGDDLPLVDEIRSSGARRVFSGSPSELNVAEYQVIYANSAFAHAMVAKLQCETIPVISHIHELELGLDGLDVLNAGKQIDHYIAAAHCVRDNLHERHGIPSQQISVCPSFVDTSKLEMPTLVSDRESIRQLGISDESRIVGAVGSLWYYKAPELFVDLAERVVRRSENTHFVRVGGDPIQAEYRELLELIDQRGLNEVVHVVPESRNVSEYLQAFDVFALTSREDPFPLVVLEASTLGVPVVAFSTGGARELLDAVEGEVVEYPNLDRMADRVIALLGDPVRCRELGTRARERVRNHYDVSVVAPAILDVIVTTASLQKALGCADRRIS